MENALDLTLNDFRLRLAGRDLVPLMQGGMGVNISTKAMALAVAAKGGIGLKKEREYMVQTGLVHSF